MMFMIMIMMMMMMMMINASRIPAAEASGNRGYYSTQGTKQKRDGGGSDDDGRSDDEHGTGGWAGRDGPYLWSERLEWQPPLIKVHNFLTDGEIEHIVERVAPMMMTAQHQHQHAHESPSDAKQPDLEGIHAPQSPDMSTNSTSPLWTGTVQHWHDAVMKRIQRRLARLTMFPEVHSEDLLLQRETPGSTERDAHADGIDEHKFRFRNGSTAYSHLSGRQRIATVLVFLSNVEEGGDTIFPYAGKTDVQAKKMHDSDALLGGGLASSRHSRKHASRSKCHMWNVLRVKPKRGDAVFFYNLDTENRFSSSTSYTACPVAVGTKWTLTLHINAQRTCLSLSLSLTHTHTHTLYISVSHRGTYVHAHCSITELFCPRTSVGPLLDDVCA